MCQETAISPGPGTDDRRHGLPEDPTDDEKGMAFALTIFSAIIGGPLSEILGGAIGGILTFGLGQASSINKSSLDGKLNLYLRVVTTQMYDRFTRLTTFMNNGFSKLDSVLVEKDYNKTIYVQTEFFRLKFDAVMKYAKDENSTEEERAQVAKDFLDYCNKHQPIDVLYALYRRISKSAMDLNFAWKAITNANYHHAAFAPWKEHIHQVSRTLVVCQIMYIALQYRKERGDEKYTEDDAKEAQRVLDLFKQVDECLEKIEEDRKELYFPRMAEKFFDEEIGLGLSQCLTPEDRILFKLKSHFPWHEFLLIRWKKLSTSGKEIQQWKSEPENLKYMEKESGGVVYRIIRMENGLCGDLYGNLGYTCTQLNNEAINNYDQGASYTAFMEVVMREVKADRFNNNHWFTFVLEYTSGHSGKGRLDEQDFFYKSTSGCHFAYQPMEIYGDRSKKKFITCHQVFIGNVGFL